MKESSFIDHYLEMQRKRFAGEPHLLEFLGEMRTAYAWTAANCSSQEVHVGDGCALVHKTKNGEVQFGFLVWPSEPDLDVEFWDAIKSTAASLGAARFSGPIQGTTYFPYRWVSASEGEPFFKGEYFSTPDDHQRILAFSPSNQRTYRSGKRDRFEGIMAVSKPYFDKAQEMGIEMVAHSNVDESLFRSVYALIAQIFGENWSFQELSESEARQIYTKEFETSSPLMLHTFHHNNKMIGFCRYIENDTNTLICKTLGLLPEYRKMGLGNATVYKMHEDAITAGYQKMIYALIVDSNRVQQNMPKDDSVIFRKYATYEFKV